MQERFLNDYWHAVNSAFANHSLIDLRRVLTITRFGGTFPGRRRGYCYSRGQTQGLQNPFYLIIFVSTDRAGNYTRGKDFFPSSFGEKRDADCN